MSLSINYCCIDSLITEFYIFWYITWVLFSIEIPPVLLLFHWTPHVVLLLFRLITVTETSIAAFIDHFWLKVTIHSLLKRGRPAWTNYGWLTQYSFWLTHSQWAIQTRWNSKGTIFCKTEGFSDFLDRNCWLDLQKTSYWRSMFL